MSDVSAPTHGRLAISRAIAGQGVNTRQLDGTFADAFTHAEQVKPSTVQRFWNEFNRARSIYRRNAGRPFTMEA